MPKIIHAFICLAPNDVAEARMVIQTNQYQEVKSGLGRVTPLNLFMDCDVPAAEVLETRLYLGANQMTRPIPVALPAGSTHAHLVLAVETL